jgi:hypothetical protein
MERSVGAALSSLPTGQGTSASKDWAAQDLARRLAGNDVGATLTEWAASRRLEPTQVERRLDKLAAELGTLDPEGASIFIRRLATVAAEMNAGRGAS